MYRTSINMYMYVFVFLWIFVLYNETVMTTRTGELSRGVKAILRCAPPNVYHRLIQHIKNGTFTGITNLDMSNCKITNLTSGTFNFEAFIKIKILQLNYNQISRLPSDIFHASALFTLEKLYLDRNRISYLSPKQFVYLYKLQFLGVSYNQLKNIQPGIFATNPLATLRLSFNFLETLPCDLFAGNISSTLKILNLRRNRLKEIHPCLFQSNTSESIFPKLELLDVSRNNIKELPPELFYATNWYSLKRLFLEFNSLTRLPPRVFYPLHLQNVTKNDSIHSSSNTWTMGYKNLINLEYLSLHHNQITSFSPKQFSHLQKLNHLDLGFNSIRSKHLVPMLFSSDSLITLDLSGNRLEKVPGYLFSGKISTTLKVLLLDRNELTEVPRCLCQSNASKAVFFKLEVINLGRNDIKHLPTELFNSTSWSSLKTIYLYRNNISSLSDGIFESSYLYSLAKIDLSYNTLKTVPRYLFQNPALLNLKKLKFHHNQITFLPEKLFNNPYLNNVIGIELNNNRIKSIPENFFKHLTRLENIDLRNNKIKHFSQIMLPKKLHQICKLDLSHNEITSTGELIRTVLRKSQILNSKKCILDLSHNSLTVQETNFFPLNTEPKHNRIQIQGTFDISNNKISKFEVATCETVPLFSIKVFRRRDWLYAQGNKVFSVVNLVKAALHINLNHIKLGSACLKTTKLTSIEMHKLLIFIAVFKYEYDCNCDMLKYLELHSSEYFVKAAEKYERHSHYWDKNAFIRLKCGSPEHLRGQFLFKVNKIELQCKHSRCTENKKCACTETPHNSTVRINCTKSNIKLMPPIIEQNSSKLEIYMGFNSIQQFPIANMSISLYVILLDLSFNCITNIPSTFFINYPNITRLNLVGNHLTTIPSKDEWKMINSLVILELKGNNFICNCSGLQLKITLTWLNARQRTKVEHLNQIICSSPSSVKDKIIYNLPNSFFGCPFVNLVLILTLTLSLLLFILVVLFLVYFFRYYINLFLFIHFGWRFCYSYTKDETVYDAFISYSAEDRDWVIDQLMNPLENLDPPYNLCLHERDFLVGVPICDNITRAIEGSKCTICVVSKNWLESDWCQFEFRVAHCLATVEKKTRLLVILKEEIPKDKVKGELKFYMKTFTYLDSAHPLFWSRLLNDLPIPYGEELRNDIEHMDDIELIKM